MEPSTVVLMRRLNHSSSYQLGLLQEGQLVLLGEVFRIRTWSQMPHFPNNQNLFKIG